MEELTETTVLVRFTNQVEFQCPLCGGWYKTMAPHLRSKSHQRKPNDELKLFMSNIRKAGLTAETFDSYMSYHYPSTTVEAPEENVYLPDSPANSEIADSDANEEDADTYQPSAIPARGLMSAVSVIPEEVTPVVSPVDDEVEVTHRETTPAIGGSPITADDVMNAAEGEGEASPQPTPHVEVEPEVEPEVEAEPEPEPEVEPQPEVEVAPTPEPAAQQDVEPASSAPARAAHPLTQTGGGGTDESIDIQEMVTPIMVQPATQQAGISGDPTPGPSASAITEMLAPDSDLITPRMQLNLGSRPGGVASQILLATGSAKQSNVVDDLSTMATPQMQELSMQPDLSTPVLHDVGAVTFTSEPVPVPAQLAGLTREEALMLAGKLINERAAVVEAGRRAAQHQLAKEADVSMTEECNAEADVGAVTPVQEG